MKNTTITEISSEFFNVPYIQNYLNKTYNFFSFEDADKYSFKNAYSFIYYLEHGSTYFKQGVNAPLSIQPVLYFYGTVQYLKACILLTDPAYPASSHVLAHGVTTRKKKKQSYDFIHDEVKLQKEGLFPHFCKKMFHMEHFYVEKYQVLSLLSQIPELNHLLYKLSNIDSLKTVSINSNKIFFPNEFFSNLKTSIHHFSGGSFNSLINNIKEDTINKTYIAELNHSILPSTHASVLHPFYFNSKDQLWYMVNNYDLKYYLPEISAHYLILYNLSMVCRYDTDWWIELLHSFSTIDYSIILEFLKVVPVKLPFLVTSYINWINQITK